MENDEEDPIIPIGKLIEVLTATAERCLFIPGRINRVSVGLQLDLLGPGLPEAREAHRQTVDRLLTAALLHSTEQSTDQLFRESQPIHLALVFDRLLAAQHALLDVRKKYPAVTMPIHPSAFVQQLLFQTLSPRFASEALNESLLGI